MSEWSENPPRRSGMRSLFSLILLLSIVGGALAHYYAPTQAIWQKLVYKISAHYKEQFPQLVGLVPWIDDLFWLSAGVAGVALLILGLVSVFDMRYYRDAYLQRALDAENHLRQLTLEFATLREQGGQSLDRIKMDAEARANAATGIVKEMTSLAKDTARLAQRINEGVTKAQHISDFARTGEQAMEAVKGDFDGYRQQLQNVAAQVQHLCENAARFKDAIGAVNDLANQVSVVTLNASIRGDGVGDSASTPQETAEMRRLADASTRTKQEIESLCQRIQDDAQRAMEVLKRIADGFATPAVVEQIQATLKGIEKTHKRLVQGMGLSEDKLAEHIANTEHAHKRLDELSNIIAQSNAEMLGILASVGKLDAVSQHLDTDDPDFDNNP